MLVVDRSIVEALVSGSDNGIKARRLIEGVVDISMPKGAAMAMSLDLMGRLGIGIMPQIGAALRTHGIVVRPESAGELTRANQLLARLGSPQPHWSGWEITIGDCLAWAAAEIGGRKLASLNRALLAEAGEIAVHDTAR